MYTWGRSANASLGVVPLSTAQKSHPPAWAVAASIKSEAKRS